MLYVPTPIQSWYIILGLLFSEQERQSPWDMELSKHQNRRNGGILAGRCQSAVPSQFWCGVFWDIKGKQQICTQGNFLVFHLVSFYMLSYMKS